MVDHHAQGKNRVDAPWVVALTGGVAAGKSAVAERFQARGIAVHDADVAAREVVAPGSTGLQAITATFGAEVLDADGALDRQAMRQRIFADEDARRKLEAIVHPAVRERLRACVAADCTPYCILAIPLLAETWPQYDWADRVLVVDAPEALRRDRLMHRDGIDEALAGHMLASQVSRERRLELADDVIDNSGTPEQLDHAVDALHHRYLELAAKKSR
jgi:dephospho-CoA kinase